MSDIERSRDCIRPLGGPFDDEAGSEMLVPSGICEIMLQTRRPTWARSRLLRHLRPNTWNLPGQDPPWIRDNFAVKGSMGNAGMTSP
jgi:hypothetical protein